MKHLIVAAFIMLSACQEQTKPAEPEVRYYPNMVEQCTAQPELPWCVEQERAKK